MTVIAMPLTAGRRAFGENPGHYDQARPDYPEALYARLAETCALQGARIFEVGPGTGLATRRLLACDPRSLQVMEPDDRLAAYLTARFADQAPPLQVLRAPFEEADLPLASYDLGVAATAFHWVEQGPALDKVVRLLRPGGWWAMWWNVYGDPDHPDPFQQATDSLFRALPNSPSWLQDGSCPFSLDAEARLSQMRGAGLTDTACHVMRWQVTLDTAQVLALVATFSQVSLAGQQARQRFLEQVGELMERQFGGRVERSFLTSLYVGRKPE